MSGANDNDMLLEELKTSFEIEFADGKVVIERGEGDEGEGDALIVRAYDENSAQIQCILAMPVSVEDGKPMFKVYRTHHEANKKQPGLN